MRGEKKQKMEKSAKSSLLYLSLILFGLTIMLSFRVVAQPMDADADGVVDAADICPQTSSEEGLPIVTQNKEYLGCSCSQIYAKIGQSNCFDVFCSTDRPFSMKQRVYSSRMTNCPADYCINSVLYEYPENHNILCVDGKEVAFSCELTIIENSELCKNGSVPQIRNELNSEEEGEGIVLLDDYEKLQRRAYAAAQDISLKSNLGISGESIFVEQSDKTMDALVVEKNLRTETKTIGGNEKIISIKTIKIIPDKRKSFRKVYIFEELPRGSKVNSIEVIPEANSNAQIVLQEDGPPVMIVWGIEKISEPIEITYQVNRQLQGDSNTLIIAKEVHNGFWKLMILPVLVIIVAVIMFIRESEKSIPKRKKIFKE